MPETALYKYIKNKDRTFAVRDTNGHSVDLLLHSLEGLTRDRLKKEWSKSVQQRSRYLDFKSLHGSRSKNV